MQSRRAIPGEFISQSFTRALDEVGGSELRCCPLALSTRICSGQVGLVAQSNPGGRGGGEGGGEGVRGMERAR